MAHAAGAKDLRNTMRRIHTNVAVHHTIIPKDNVYMLQPRKSNIQNKRNIIRATASNIKKLVLENKIVSNFMFGIK